MKKIIMILCACLLFGCSADPGLPDGYTLLCSDDGVYSLKSESFGNGMSANTWWTKAGAKAFAWRWEGVKNKAPEFESSKHIWRECE